MKTALILTTINVPRVLALYRRLDPDVFFFVAGDLETPREACRFCDGIPNCEFYTPDRQKELGWECSSLLGWNTVTRRNIALLEALKWGARLIISIDDDNIPLDRDYFHSFRELWGHPRVFDGLKVKSGWFDPGHLSFPQVSQRGFPQQLMGVRSFEPVTNVRIGVAQGAVLGDPDTSAVDRISRHPMVHQASELLRAGVVSDPRETWAPLNSQNIAFLRELAPCFLMVPQFGRYDDIFAGLVAQRIMREKGFFVHYGRPFVWQQRNAHDLVSDLKDELWGMENVVMFAEMLNNLAGVREPLEVTGMVDRVYTDFKFASNQVRELSMAWLEDCRKAMG